MGLDFLSLKILQERTIIYNGEIKETFKQCSLSPIRHQEGIEGHHTLHSGLEYGEAQSPSIRF